MGIHLSHEDQDPEFFVAKLRELLAPLNRDMDVGINRPPKIFSREDIMVRFVDHWDMAQDFIEYYQKRYGIALHVDPRLLYLAIVSAWDDIERYKLYHLQEPYNQRSDAIKRAAYLTKWITKIGPLYSVSPEQDASLDQISEKDLVDTRPALANIFFSLFASTAHLMHFLQINFVLEEDVAYEICYDLLFRRINEDTLLSWFQFIAKNARGELVVIDP